MLILLPPSEGKTAPEAGDPVDLERLSHPELAAVRRRIGDALVAASARRNAHELLGVGPSLSAELERNTRLWSEPAAPAARVYTGVLYDAAGAAQWDGERLTRAQERIRVVSALWGAVGPADAIPAYRLPMTTTLPRIGPLAALWRRHLAAALDPLATGVVVDLRSSSYAGVWRPPAEHWLTVRVERDVDGKRSVVSHFAKHTRGLLAGALVAASSPAGTSDDVAECAATLIGAEGSSTGLGRVVGVELGPPGAQRHLTMVIA